MSNKPNDGGPAFPCHTNQRPGILANAPQGMSLRAYFAGQALAGICASAALWDWSYSKAAEHAVAEADALIQALTAQKEPSHTLTRHIVANVLATNIVDAIMQEMDGRQSARLVMESQDGRLGSGWARKPLIEHITKILERSAAPPPQQ